MSLSSADLTKGFQQLKTQARSDADIGTWLANHPEMLPDIPPALAPFLIVDDISSAGFQQRFDGQPQRKVCLQYRIEKEDALSVDGFEKITGVEIECDTTRQPLVTRTLFLMLSPFEWPYVMALAGKTAMSLDLSGNNARNFYQRIAAGWGNMHPHISWETIVELHKSDLLPESDADMIAWVCDGSNMLHSPQALPLDIAP